LELFSFPRALGNPVACETRNRTIQFPKRKELIVGVTRFKLPILALAAAALAMAPSALGSSITFTLGNHPQPGEDNVLLNTGTTGTTVFGQTNTSHFPVQFTSTQTLTEPSIGQARVQAVSGGLTNVTISVPGESFADLIFNPDITGTIGVPGGTLHVSVTDIHGMVFAFDYDLGNGSNFLTITASGDSLVSASLSYSDAGGFTDLRQVRVSGLTAVPEPATSVLGIFGLGFIALLLRRRGVSDRHCPSSGLA
jgi:hypothetical protein